MLFNLILPPRTAGNSCSPDTTFSGTFVKVLGAEGVRQLRGGQGALSERVSIEDVKSNWIHIQSPAGRGRPADM